MFRFKIELKAGSYPLFIGTNILEKVGEIFNLYNFGSKTLVITNSLLEQSYSKFLEKGFEKYGGRIVKEIILDDEKHKNLDTIQHICSILIKEAFDSSSVIVGFGGGVISDVAGFVAATFLEGISCVLIPTSLVAQIDSSVSDKVWLNHPLRSKAISISYLPKLVWIDVALLKTLPKEEFLSGLAEVVKYAVVWDEALFSFLEEKLENILELDPAALQEIVHRSCQIKSEIFRLSLKDKSKSSLLNLGHVMGEAVRVATKEKLSHGETLVLGMLIESLMALKLGLFELSEFKRLERLLLRLGGKAKVTDLNFGELKRIVQKTGWDKQRLVLPTKIGQAFPAKEMEIKI